MAGSVIKVGMDVTDVRAAGIALLKQLDDQLDATLKLAEAQVKYNKAGEQVGSVLKGMTDSGERYNLVIKQTAEGYQLVNAQVIKAKTSFAEQAKAQKAAAEAAREEAKAQEDAAKARTNMLARLEVAGRRGLMAQEAERSLDASRGPLRSGGVAGPPAAPPPPASPGYFDSLFGGAASGAEKAQKASERLFITWQGIVRLIEAQVIKRMINEIGGAFADAVTTAKKFSISIAEIQTISQDMPLSTERWRMEITKLSGAFGQTQADVANAAYETLSNQVAKGPQVFEFLATAMKFGAATVTSTTDSVNLLSSALKSFNLPVENAERIAAIFFKTIDLGRVRARDLANTFGRVGAIANQAGIKIEEVAAAIATISVRGVAPADTMTILSNLITSLIKPTTEMKELFKEWGVANADAAFQTFGFQGVLAKLNEESKLGSNRIAELTPNIRAMRGAFQLSGQGMSDYAENFRKVTTAQQEYNKAANIVLDSPGKQLEIAGQKIKNLFTEDFGKVAVETLANFNRMMETSKGAADGLERSVKLVVKGLVAMGVALVTIKILTIANIAATETWGQMFANLAIKATNAGVAIAKALPLLAAFAAGYAVGEVLFNPENTGGQSRGDIIDAIRKKNDAQADSARKYKEVNGDADLAVTDSVKKSLDTRYQFALSYTTGVVRLSEALKKRTIDDYRDITDAVKVSSKTYFDSITGKISELRKNVAEAEQLIKGSLKQSQDLPRKLGGELFHERLKYANEGRMEYAGGTPQVVDNQKVSLLQNRVQFLLAEARVKAKEGTKEAFEESRKLYDDVQKLMGQLFEAKTNADKRVFEKKVEMGQVAPTRQIFDPTTGQLKPQFEFVVKTVEFEKELNSLGKERLNTERQFRDLQKLRAENAEREIAREKERLRGLQQAFAAIEKIEVFSKEGKVKDEFKKDPGLAARQFDEQAAKIKSLAGNEGFGTQYQVFQDLQKQKEALVRQVNAAIRAEEAETAQQGIVRAKKNTQTLIESAGATVAKGRTAVTAGLSQLDEDLAVLEGRSLRMQTLFKIPGTNIEIGSNLPGTMRAEPKRQEALALLTEVRAASKAFNDDQSATKLATLKEKLDALKLATAQYLQLFTGQDPSNIKDAGDTKTQMQRIRGLDAGVGVAEGGLGRIAEGSALQINALDQAKELDKRLRALPGAAAFFAEGMREQAPVVNETFDQFTASALKLTTQMQLLNAELRETARTLPQARGNRELPPPPVEGNFFGGPPKGVKYMNFGGFVPRGSDVVPAMLGRDEYVMTGAATKSFMPLLRAMNAYPTKYMSSGGPVTNVGDINVSVTGGDTSAATVGEIAVALRRGIRRGTINLND